MNKIILFCLALVLFSCKNRRELISEKLELDNYLVIRKKIDRGTIYINDEYYFDSYMIRYDRRRKMDSLYFFKAPFYLSKNSNELILKNDEDQIEITLQYENRAYK